MRVSQIDRRVPRSALRLLGVPGLALAALALAGGCRRRDLPPPPPPPAVTVAKPVEREVVEWDEYTGRLEAVDAVDVRARVGGLIVAAPFTEGAIVKQGDLLVEIDARPFQADLDSKLADQARAEAQVELAEIDLRRMEAIPPKDRSLTEYDSATATLRQAQAVRAAAQAAVAASRLNVEWCRVTAPITGRIGRKAVTPGNLITGGGAQATLLTTINSIDPIYCTIDVDDESVLKYQRLANEHEGLDARQARIRCFLQLSDEVGFPYQGVIDFIDNRVDPTTGTMRWRGVFANANDWLKPGFFARVRIPGSGRYRARLVPDAAVATDQDQKYLLVVGPNEKVEVRPVKLGALFGDLRAIVSGIGPDDRVVVNGQMRARPGVQVNASEVAVATVSTSLAALDPPDEGRSTATTGPAEPRGTSAGDPVSAESSSGWSKAGNAP